MAITKIVTISDKVRFIESIFGAGNMARNERNFAIWCPLCAPKDKNKRKLVIRLDDDANHCWTCTWRARTLAPLLKRYANHEDLIHYCDTFMSPGTKNLWTSHTEVKKKKIIRLPSDFSLLPLSDSKNPDVRSLFRYLNTRNITERDMWYFKLGHSDENPWYRRVMIPSFDADGNLNYLVGRAVDRQKQRYENEEVDRTSIVFNELHVNWKKRLVICEGPFDMMKCGDNATCLLGSSLNENHLLFDKIITNSTPVALALDSTAKSSAIWIAKKLKEYDIEVTLVDLGAYSDPGEMTKSSFKEALASAKPYSWLTDFQNKMMKASKVSLSSW